MCVCLSVLLSDESCKMAEPVVSQFGLSTHVGPMNHVLAGSRYGRHLANTIDQFVFGGTASSITVASCFSCCDKQSNVSVSASGHYIFN